MLHTCVAVKSTLPVTSLSLTHNPSLPAVSLNNRTITSSLSEKGELILDASHTVTLYQQGIKQGPTLVVNTTHFEFAFFVPSGAASLDLRVTRQVGRTGRLVMAPVFRHNCACTNSHLEVCIIIVVMWRASLTYAIRCCAAPHRFTHINRYRQQCCALRASRLLRALW